MRKFDVVITVNSPGELSALVRPTVEKLAETHPEIRIILVVTPCQYASGRELEVARKFKGISEIILPEEYKRWIWQGKAPQGIKFGEEGLVLFMGGDLLHAVLLSKKLRYKALAYTERLQWIKNFNRFLVPDKLTYDRFLKKVPKEKVRLVGNLMVDGINLKFGKEEAKVKWELSKSPIITLMPGSRFFQIKYMTAFFVRVAELITEECADAQFLLNLSPYVTLDKIEKAINPHLKDNWTHDRQMGTSGFINYEGDKKYIVSQQGVRVQLIENSNYEAMNVSDLILTIPGTNTAEIAALGIPMVVVFPLNKPEIFPLEGLLGILSELPLLGKLIKRGVVSFRNRSTKYFALPNMKAQAEITPEVRGQLKASDVAEVTMALLKDENRRKAIGRKLKEIMGERGAVGKIIYEIISAGT